jgi:hypothetical protein
MYSNRGISQLKDFADSLKKSLTIKYISSTVDDKNINLTFEIIAKNLKTDKAKIYVEEINATNETAVPLTNIEIEANNKKNILVSFDKNKQFDNYFWQDGFLYQATITCDGISVETEEFTLKIIQTNETGQCDKVIVPKLKLTEDEKKKFICTILCESQLGNEKLQDIAWVYYNRVNLYGVDHHSGLKASNPYRKKLLDYRLCSYYYKIGNIYANDKYGDFTIKGYIDTKLFKSKDEPKFKKMELFIEKEIFCEKPKTCFKDWIGQGYWGDLDLNPDDPLNSIQDPKWYMARHYYWLQIEKKVTIKYVHILRAGTGTTFIFDEKKIASYFKTNPKMLAKPKDVRKFRSEEAILNFDL